VDTLVPTVNSIVASPSTGDKNTGNTILLTLTLNKNALVTGTPALTLNDGGTAVYQSGSGSNVLKFAYTVANAQNTSALAVTGNNLNGSSVAVTDADGNSADLAGANVTFTGLAIGATVQSVTSTPTSGDLGPGKVITFTVTMTEAVTVTGGTPTLSLNDGGTATYKSGSGSNVLNFTYTVGALGSGQNAAALAVTGFNSNGATIYDSGVLADTADLRGVTSFVAGPQIDTTAPTVSSVVTNPATGDLGAGQSVTLTVNFSENVVVTGSPFVSLNDGGKATYVSGSGSNALTFTYTVAAGQNTPDLTVTGLSANGGTIKDGAGNNAVLGGAVTNPAGTLQIDTTAPKIASIATSGTAITAGKGDLGSGSTLTLTVNFNENVIVDTTAGTPTLALNDGGTATYTGGSGSSALTFSYTVGALGSGQNTADLAMAATNALSLNGAKIADGAGNAAVLTLANGYNPAGTLQIDTIAPTVISVVASPVSGEVTTGHLVKITLNTSEAVNVTGTPELLLNDGGIANYDAAKSTSKAMVFDYNVAAGQVTTDLVVSGIELPSTAAIADLAGNKAVLSGAAADLGLHINTASTGAAGPGTGSFTINGNSSVELFGASAANVTFASNSTGTLKLDAASLFSGTVAGLALGNYIDLSSVAYQGNSSPTYSSNGSNTGTLAVTEGASTINVALLGSYFANSFVASSDGHGGTLVTDPPPPMQGMLTPPQYA
jgi:hypothetical protein